MLFSTQFEVVHSIYIFSITSPDGWWVGGWSDKTKLILISTLVEVEVELGNFTLKYIHNLH